MQLHPASIDEQLALIAQFESQFAVQQWGGEHFSFPLKRHSFLAQLQLSDTHGFSLRNRADEMLGFGQLCDRFDRIHLARLLIFKEFRGLGYARHLIAGLLTEGLRHWPCRDASLYVFRVNTSALRCYQQLGFRTDRQPADYRADLHFMTLPNLQVRQLVRQYSENTFCETRMP